MNYQNTQENRRKVLIGSATVNLILAVSFAATIAYWFVLAGLENSNDLSAGWYFLLWLIVGVGAVAEVIKKVTLSTYRHAAIWLVATAVSVLTVMGTYAILNANRQDQITKASDVYQDGRAMSQQGLHDATKFAHAANYNLADLESQLATVVCKRGSGHGAGTECGGGKSISYASYLSQKKELEQKIVDAKAYLNAMGTAQIGKTQMESGGSTNSSSNPLLSDIAAVTGASEKLLINLFYLAVTLLLECAAFSIGGKVEELKLEIRHSAAELLELQNKAIFGVTMAQLLGGQLPQRRPATDQNETDEANQAETTATEKSAGGKQRSGWKVTPAVGAGIGIGTGGDGLGLGLGAGVIATPKGSAKRDTSSNDQNQPTASKTDTPSSASKPTKPADDADPKSPARIDGIGFNAKYVPAKDSKNPNATCALLKPAAAPAKKELTRGTTETVFNRARTPDHTPNTPANTPKPAAQNTPKEPAKHTPNTPDTSSVYAQWKAAVMSGQIKPTVRAGRSFIQKRLSGSQASKRSVTPNELGKITNVFCAKAIMEKVLVRNANGGPGKAKYLLNAGAKQDGNS